MMHDSKILFFFFNGYDNISKRHGVSGEDLYGGELDAGILRFTSGKFQGCFYF